MKWYLSGPMSGYPKFNFPAFIDAARILRAQGLDIVSPAELDSPEVFAHAMASVDGNPGRQGGTWGEFLARDVRIIADDVDGIILLPAWEESRGAKLEAYVGLLTAKEFRRLTFHYGAEPVTPREVWSRLSGAHNAIYSRH